MAPILMKSAAAIAVAAGLAFTANEDTLSAYGDSAKTTLTRDEVADHALRVFQRADQNSDLVLDVDEYTALSVVTVELAHLNGFITIETEGEPGIVQLPQPLPASLQQSEHVRIAAVSQTAFYVFAGDDGVMSAEEFVNAQTALFDAADLNHNKMLKRRELSLFAQRQASLTFGA